MLGHMVDLCLLFSETSVLSSQGLDQSIPTDSAQRFLFFHTFSDIHFWSFCFKPFSWVHTFCFRTWRISILSSAMDYNRLHEFPLAPGTPGHGELRYSEYVTSFSEILG